MPSTRSATRYAGWSTSRWPARPAPAGRSVAASYRGVRQARARTVNETTSAATAPAMASSGGIGRSAGPPRPWASVSRSPTSADFELEHERLGLVPLHVDHARAGRWSA